MPIYAIPNEATHAAVVRIEFRDASDSLDREAIRECRRLEREVAKKVRP